MYSPAPNVGDITQDNVTALLDKVEQGKTKFVKKSGGTKFLGSTTQADATLARTPHLPFCGERQSCYREKRKF